MTNKLLGLAIDICLTAQHCNMQSTARPIYTAPYKIMICTVSQCWQAGSQGKTEEWSHAMTLLFVAAALM